MVLAFHAKVRLAWDAQGVVALRFMQIARENARGRQSETHRMVTEKIAALAEAQAAVAAAAVHGRSHRVVKKALGVYKKRVRHNKQRLRRANWEQYPIGPNFRVQGWAHVVID